MIRPAPAIRAALIVARPTPPQPITATVSPGTSLQALKMVPAPVVTAQPITAARSSGIALSMATQACSWTSIASAKPERLSIWAIALPSPAVIRGGAPRARRVSPPGQSDIRPVTQYSQWPQKAERQVTTWSPTFTVRTSLPTASTTPAASWPGMQGRGWG